MCFSWIFDGFWASTSSFGRLRAVEGADRRPERALYRVPAGRRSRLVVNPWIFDAFQLGDPSEIARGGRKCMEIKEKSTQTGGKSIEIVGLKDVLPLEHGDVELGRLSPKVPRLLENMAQRQLWERRLQGCREQCLRCSRSVQVEADCRNIYCDVYFRKAGAYMTYVLYE